MKKALSIMLALLLTATLYSAPLYAAGANITFSEAVNASGSSLDIVNDTGHPWVVTSTAGGKYCISSDIAGIDGLSTAVTLTAEFADGQGISFAWSCSSESRWDRLAFSVDGEQIAVISGEISWETKVIALSAGEHTLEWRYEKDSSYSMRNDCALLDDVKIAVLAGDENNIDDSLNSRSSTLVFENDPVNPWVASVSGGVNTGKSSIAGKDGGSTAITLRQHMTAGQAIYFSWQTDCESEWDKLSFTVNGNEVYSLSGSTALTTKSYEVTEDGDFVFRWVYSKDALNSFGADCAQVGNIRVGDAQRVTGIIVGKTASVAVGGTLLIASSVRPSSACNRNITWHSDDDDVATVSADGTVTGVSAGTVHITATTEEGGFSAYCTVTVGSFQPAATYYVNGTRGNDSLNGQSAGNAVRTLEKAVTLIEASGITSAKIVLIGNISVSRAMTVYGRQINLTTDGGSVTVSRADGYTGEIFKVLLGGELYLGDPASDESSAKTLTIGGGGAAAPALLVDGGELNMYGSVGIEGNASSVSGAGVYLKEGGFTMLAGEIKGNSTSAYGGGIFCAGGKLTLAGGSVTSNYAALDAGGVYLSADCVYDIEDGVIRGNFTQQGKYPDVNILDPVQFVAFRSDSDSGAANSWLTFSSSDPAQVSQLMTPELPVAAAERFGRCIFGFTEDGRFFRIIADTEASPGETPTWDEIEYIGEPQEYTILDMTFNYADGRMYALVTTEDNERTLASVALGNGALTPVADFGRSPAAEGDGPQPGPFMTLACDADGLFYTISGGDNAMLWQISIDGSSEYVMPLGVDAYYLQSAAFDRDSGILYWAQCGEDGCGLYAVENGVITHIGNVGGESTELTGLIIGYVPDTETNQISDDGRFTYRRLDYGGVSLTGCILRNLVGEPNFPVSENGTFSVDIPSQINGLTVSAIYDNAFKETADSAEALRLGSVRLPDTLESVGYCAFRDCSRLASVTFNGNDISLGQYAFYNCTSLTEISLPESTEWVDYGAFAGCTALTKAVLPSLTTTYDSYVFYQTSPELEIHGYFPSTAYDYAIANSITFVDLSPYTAPVVSGVEDGGSYNTYELPDGVSISWESPYDTSATLNGEEYTAGTAVTQPGEYTFIVTDGRTPVTVAFNVFYLNTDYLLGDMDGDGDITVADALAALRIAAKLVEASEHDMLTGDVDDDGGITVADALAILRVAAKLAAGF